MKNMFRRAVEWGYLQDNPLSVVKPFREDNEKMWVLTNEEEEKLLSACDARPQRAKYLKDLVLFALNSGMRQGEIFNLKKENINLSDRYIFVTDTKTHENRNVPINDKLMSIINVRIKRSESEYIFSNHEEKKLTVLTNAYWQAVKDAGLVRKDCDKNIRFRFHDLRHTFGSRLGMKGYDLKTIMEIMGHKTTKVALRYQHPTPEHKMNAVQSLVGRNK